MERCPGCGENLNDGELCGVCLFARGINPADELPDAIGRYRILRLLGEGGMGAVYEAEQEQPRRTVALKVIRTGLIGPELLRRFDKESQALARLHHPGIAQVYEAGAADYGSGPRPYFAMEFIQGQRLDEYAEERHLNTRQRLQLMIQICEAVQHAHERGIIHRDLKPGNILVEKNGQPKILDFGVARVTDADAQATRQTDIGQIVGTLAYMSPEQVLGDPLEIDTRSDVYTLGLILYQLLAGRLPYTITRHLHEAVQVIREQDPSPLSSVNRTYRGDIETIVGKALEKDKSRRYASAADLSSDIKRYLEHQPIAARPPGTAYQLGKFARRHRTLMAGVAGVFLALVAGIVASTAEANRARIAERSALASQRAATRERDRAVAAEGQAEIARTRAEQASRKEAESALQARNDRDQALRQQQRADTEAATAIAVTNFLRNDVLAQNSIGAQGGPNTKPDPDMKIRTALDRAAARIDGKFADRPLVEAAIRQTIGISYMDLGSYDEAQRQLELSLDIRSRNLGPDHPQTVIAMKSLANVLEFQGKTKQGAALFTRVLAIERRAGGKDDPETLRTLTSLANAYRILGDYAKSEQFSVEALDAQRRLLGEEHPETINAMSVLGTLYDKQGKHRQSAEMLARVLELSRRKLGEEHPHTLVVMNNLANAYLGDRQFERAEQLYREVNKVTLRLFGERHLNTLISLANIATVLSDEGKYEEAEQTFNRVVDLYRRVLPTDHPRTLGMLGHLADLYAREGKLVEAEQLLVKVLEGRRRVLGAQHPDAIKVLPQLAHVRIDLKKYADAESNVRESMAAHEKLPPDSTVRLNDQVLLGECLAGQGKYAAAELLLLVGYEGLSKQSSDAPDNFRSYLVTAGPWIVQLYRDWGKPNDAVEWTRRLQVSKVANASR